VAREKALLRAIGLGRTYGRLKALEDFSVRLAAGECVALMGPNGSGKTTAITMICGLIEPTSGKVLVDGHSVHTEPEAELARAIFSYAPDEPVLYDDLSCRQHLEFVAIAHGAGGDGLEERIDATLERWGLGDRGDFVPSELSRGMRQKLQLACATLRPFGVLILDEPVVGLDSASVRTLVELIQQTKADGGAVLISTHQPEFAAEVADRTIRLEEGRVVRSAT
jgi:ABC-2 type transport system ATP-binding protein